MRLLHDRDVVAGARPVDVQVITYAPTVFYHCQHCELTFQQLGVGDRVHREHAREALPDDLRAEFQELSEWAHRLHERHGDAVRVRVVDAASIEGVWKSLRYGARAYPTVVVDGVHKQTGCDFERLEPIIDERLSAHERGGGRGQDTEIAT